MEKNKDFEIIEKFLFGRVLPIMLKALKTVDVKYSNNLCRTRILPNGIIYLIYQPMNNFQEGKVCHCC